MEEAPENGKELLNSAHANGMNEMIETNIRKFNKYSRFLEFIISVRGGHYNYLIWVPKNLATPLISRKDIRHNKVQ